MILWVGQTIMWSALHQTFSLAPAWLAVGQRKLAAAAFQAARYGYGLAPPRSI